MERFFTGVAALGMILIGFIGGSGLVGFILTSAGFPKLGSAGAVVAVAPQVAPPVVAQKKPQAVPEILPEVKIVATEMKFAPTQINAKVGQPIKIILENKGVIEHDIASLTVKVSGASEPLKAVAKPGQTVTLEFTPTEKGSFEFICTVPGHKEAGMRGTLAVFE